MCVTSRDDKGPVFQTTSGGAHRCIELLAQDLDLLSEVLGEN